jgi:hypothetical protein
LPAGNREGVGTDRWAAAQCRAAVPLIDGSGLSAVHGRDSRVRGRAWTVREGKRWAAQVNSKVLHLFELV